jgi:hypothetical protein
MMIDHSDLLHLTNEELLSEQSYIDGHIDECQHNIKRLARQSFDKQALIRAFEDHCLAVDRLLAIRLEWARRQQTMQFNCTY